MHASDVLTSIEAAKPLTQAEFVARANALCTASVTAFASELSQFSGIKKNHSPAEIAAFVKALSPIIQSQINKTKDLSPPKSERAAVTKMLKANQTDLNMVKADPALLGASTSPFAVADSQARSSASSVRQDRAPVRRAPRDHTLLEPERRFELLTCALRVRCSTD